MRRITDLFLTGVDRFEDPQVDVFDDVLCGLIDKIERDAVAELSRDIADVAKAPPRLSRRLSRHDDIAIAGPILRHSSALGESDLIDVARSKSQLHLEAIANRSQVSEHVSDILIDRGNSIVLTTVAGNAGARFSAHGYESLAAKAEGDANIASALIGRADLSPERFRRLVAQASATVQERLLATTDPRLREQVQGVVQSITLQISRNADRAVPMRATHAGSQLRSIDKGKLRSELAHYAAAGRVAESATALATLSELSIDTARQLLTRQDFELLLIVCKACGLGWVATRTMVELAAKTRGESTLSATAFFEQYTKLSREAAERIIRFLKVRKTVTGQEIKKMLVQ